MRILVINPNTTETMTEDIDSAARRHALTSTEIQTVSAPWGVSSIEGHFDEALAAAAAVESVATHRDCVDAFVIACYGDPGLYAAREVAQVPVLGIAEASMLTACTLAHRFSVVTVLPRIMPMLRDLVRRYGLESRCASVRSSGLAVQEIGADPDHATEQIVEQAHLAADQDGAEAIALGCAGMGRLDSAVQEHFDTIPVIDGVAAAVKQCEAVHGYGLMTSKARAFTAPETKQLTGVASALRTVTAR